MLSLTKNDNKKRILGNIIVADAVLPLTQNALTKWSSLIAGHAAEMYNSDMSV